MSDAAPRGTHRLLCQWLTIVEERNGGVIVRFEDGSVSEGPIDCSEIIDMASVAPRLIRGETDV
jgi:hypothetical protein